MTISTPPVGARVRHTTTYTDSTTVHAEGTVTETQRDNGFFIGDRDSALAAMVSVNNESVYLAPAVAREAAGVLLRAVREFEERQR